MKNLNCLVHDCPMNFDGRCCKIYLRIDEKGRCILNKDRIIIKEKEGENNGKHKWAIRSYMCNRKLCL